MASCIDYHDLDLDLALLALAKMRRMTGDGCCLIRTGYLWRIVRYDPSGKEVLWE